MMCEVNALLIKWDSGTIDELEAELAEVELKLSACREDSQQLTDEISQGIGYIDGFGNRLADGEDFYHCVVAGLEQHRSQLEARLVSLKASTAFAKRTQYCPLAKQLN